MEIYVSWSFRDASTKQNRAVKNIYIAVYQDEKSKRLVLKVFFKIKLFCFIILFNSLTVLLYFILHVNHGQQIVASYLQISLFVR